MMQLGRTNLRHRPAKRRIAEFFVRIVAFWTAPYGFGAGLWRRRDNRWRHHRVVRHMAGFTLAFLSWARAALTGGPRLDGDENRHRVLRRLRRLMSGHFRALLRWSVEPYRGWLFSGLGDAMWARNGRKLGLAGFFGALFAWAATPFGLGRLGEQNWTRHGVRRLSGGLAMTMVAATAMAFNSGPTFHDHRDESSHPLAMASLNSGGQDAVPGDPVGDLVSDGSGGPTDDIPGAGPTGLGGPGGGAGGPGGGSQPPSAPDFNFPFPGPIGGGPGGGMMVLAGGGSPTGGPQTPPSSDPTPPADTPNTPSSPNGPGTPGADSGGSGGDGGGFGFGGGSGGSSGGGFGGGAGGGGGGGGGLGSGGGKTTASNGGGTGGGTTTPSGGGSTPPDGGLILVSTSGDPGGSSGGLGGGTGGGCVLTAINCLSDPVGPTGGDPTQRFGAAPSLLDFGPTGGPDQTGDSGPGIDSPAGAVPEPAAWLMMIMGFFCMGGALRARRRTRSA